MVDKVQNKTHKWKWLNWIYTKLYGYRLEPKKNIYQVGDVMIGHPITLKRIIDEINKDHKN
jgi:hypothetical protein